ncbi:GNAT family N-acetyltransferase [Actinosynnema sp. NPDC047251]|uniref:GNAT family N-acetyltransferase n=1 Tax=Saccharothrix espanaensis TaxID=103731 RepID=UPI001E530B65|nr:GNAT family N-acetyltransferase [Saccharothrix espanaensis]
MSSDRLLLEPLRVGHAEEMAVVLAAPELYTFTGGEPPTVDDLSRTYARQVRGRSADGGQWWLNWVVRRRDTGHAVGYVQATVDTARPAAELAWVVGTAHQGLGFAQEAAGLVVDALRAAGITRFTAHVHPDHAASAAVARRVGLLLTDTVEDGEQRWESPCRSPPVPHGARHQRSPSRRAAAAIWINTESCSA